MVKKLKKILIHQLDVQLSGNNSKLKWLNPKKFLRARSSAWLERSTDNRKAMSSNLIGPTFYYIFSNFV